MDGWMFHLRDTQRPRAQKSKRYFQYCAGNGDFHKMPNRRKYRHRVPFSTSFEGDFLDEFRKECKAEDKDVNEVQQSLMEEWLRRKYTIREQQKLSIYGYRADQQPQQQQQQVKAISLPDVKKQIEALLGQLPQALDNTTSHPPRNRDEAKLLAQRIGVINGLFNEGAKIVRIHLTHFGREAKLTA